MCILLLLQFLFLITFTYIFFLKIHLIYGSSSFKLNFIWYLRLLALAFNSYQINSKILKSIQFFCNANWLSLPINSFAWLYKFSGFRPSLAIASSCILNITTMPVCSEIWIRLRSERSQIWHIVCPISYTTTSFSALHQILCTFLFY